MKRYILVLAAAGWALLAASAWGITRINGNQLLEGTGEFGFADARRSGEATGAPRLIYSVGQGVMARGSLPDSAAGSAFAVGFGLGYDIARYIVCPVRTTGDLNSDQSLSASDLVLLVQFVYKSAPSPEPCPAIGDVNCSGNITASDVMVMVNHIFKGAPPPCNVCSLIPDSWPCY